MQSISAIKYKAIAYARASKDGADSGTIGNQIELIRGFADSKPDIDIVGVREDNGFSGMDFARPSFMEMMKDIEAGKINCVIVKDLSRLGRNYIEVGELMEDVFPQYKVRLIAVNDNYDSLNPRTDSDEIIIPFRNLINEQYLRDFSVKIRSNLDIKRKNGEFVGAFAPYGYKRSDSDKHLLVVDEHAAGVIRNIFRLKIRGMGGQKIAQHLNDIGEPSPADYKKHETNYTTVFQTHSRALWSAVTVSRILRNPVYIGTLIQGKQTTPSYKVKCRIDKPEGEWHTVPDAHEAIIGMSDFEIVNGLLSLDTRSAPSKKTVYPLSGLVYCGDCGNSMVRTKSGDVFYYICASSKARKKECTSHCIRQDKLERAVMEAVTLQIAATLDAEKYLEYMRSLSAGEGSSLKLNSLIEDREQEIKSCERYKRSLYEDYKSGIISKEDFIEFGKDYTARVTELYKAIDKLREESELLPDSEASSGAKEWMEHFTRYGCILEFNRQLAVNLIGRIEVFAGKRLSIIFRYQDKLEMTREIISYALQEAGCARCPE